MQIEKLRSRLQNAGKTTTEYRMTILEARELLAEVDQLKKRLEEKLHPVVKVVEQKIEPSIRIWDGGSLV